MTSQSPGSFTGELPRKKSRNYLDSHKNIEKKRRDRINLCLNQLKSLVPDCRQYVSTQVTVNLFVMWVCLIHRATRNWTKLRFWK